MSWPRIPGSPDLVQQVTFMALAFAVVAALVTSAAVMTHWRVLMIAALWMYLGVLGLMGIAIVIGKWPRHE